MSDNKQAAKVIIAAFIILCAGCFAHGYTDGEIGIVLMNVANFSLLVEILRRQS